ncbi:MAG TPA: hypothetical protein VIC85_14355, partial [Ktedonobacterales bacterium]
MRDRQSAESGAHLDAGALSAAGAPVLAVRDLTKVYPVGRGRVTALSHVTLTLAPGAFVAIRGRSGAGKTTL